MTESIQVNLEPMHDMIMQSLRTSICEINFEKADGSRRKLIGTLHPSKLPAPKKDKEVVAEAAQQKPELATVIKVFDLEANAWRSFKMGSFIGIRVTENLEAA